MATVAVSEVVVTIPGGVADSATVADEAVPPGEVSVTVAVAADPPEVASVIVAVVAGLPGVASVTAADLAGEADLPEEVATPANFSSVSTATGTASSTRTSRKAPPES